MRFLEDFGHLEALRGTQPGQRRDDLCITGSDAELSAFP